MCILYVCVYKPIYIGVYRNEELSEFFFQISKHMVSVNLLYDINYRSFKHL